MTSWFRQLICVVALCELRTDRRDVWAEKQPSGSALLCGSSFKREPKRQAAMQMDCEPNPVTTATAKQPLDSDTDRAETAQNGSDTLDVDNIPATSVEDKTVMTSNEDEAVRTDETPADVAAPRAEVHEHAVPPVTEPCDNSEEMAVDQACQPSAPAEPTAATNTEPVCEVQKSNKKKDKVVQDGRKYVPSKKAMKDPLKMDMSSQLVLPLTSSELSLQCIECHIIFSDHKSKRRHIKLSHPDVYERSILTNALFVCYVCERQFTNSTDLMAHQKGHVEKKPFHCPICSQAFKRSSELTLHKKVHLGKDGYVCMDCGKACKTLTLMKYHIRTHTGERPYVCAECGERFRFSKALQKHTLTHTPEGAEGNQGVTPTKVKLKKKDDASTIKHPCSICKATFKTSRTLLRHMKNKHTLSHAASSNTCLAGQQRKHITPVITPISICQPALLQVEPNGPLQKVDANIDTEPIRRLIESLGNVQKVNQVVILGQVPLHAPPLEVQQTPVLAEQGHVNVDPPQLDLIGVKQMGLNTLDFSNSTCDTMEQTIILEPITPEGQLENPSFSELGSQIAAGENIELRLVHSEPTAGSEGDGMQKTIQQPEVNAVQSDPLHSMVYNCDGIDLEQTVILELTPALMPTAELEQSQNAPQSEILPSSLVLTTEMEKAPSPNPDPAQTAAGEHDSRLSVPLRSGDLDLTPSLTDHQDQPVCPYVLPDTFKEALSDAGSYPKEEARSQTEPVTVVQVHLETDVGTPQETRESTAPEAREEVLSERVGSQEQVENPPGVEEPSTKEKVPSRAKESPPISPVNVMSAQELVKVRKRKPARGFIFQGYMQELAGSVYNDDFQIDAKPAKRQRGKKSHLVVKFGPQNKERKNKKQRKSSKKQQSTQDAVMRGKGPKLPDRKVSSQKKDRKGSKGKKAGHSASAADMNSQPLTQEQVENTKKNKMKKQDVVEVAQHMGKPKSPFKKKLQSKLKQKSLSLNAKDRKITGKELTEEKVQTKRSSSTADTLSPHITQDTLLLLKGHKQPQLKVYKLDPSQASGKTQEASVHEPETVSKQKKDKQVKHQTTALSEVQVPVSAEAKKKGGRPKKYQKALSLLSSLEIPPHSQETPPVKSKTTRKRKSSSNIETEGVITSSERSLSCKDCGETFSEVSSLQKHKAMVHVAESPGLTYTNGNIFEGVSRSDLTKLPKCQDAVTGTMNAASDWDTEPEMTFEDRERNVSFPALIPSPSLPAPPTDVEMSGYEDQRGAASESPPSVNVQSLTDQLKTSEISSQVLCNTPSNSSTQTESWEAREPLVSNEDKRAESPYKDSSSESPVQAKVEDIKDDDLLEVDLVTVGEQNERVGLCFPDESISQNESSGSCYTNAGCCETLPPTGQVDNAVAKISQGLHVACATQQVEIKKEDDELVFQEGKSVGMGAENVTKDVSTGSGHRERGVTSQRVVVSNAVRETESEEDCLVIYEEHTVTSEVHEEDESSTQTSQPEIGCERDPDKRLASASSLPSLTSTSEEPPEERVELELQSVPTTAADVTNEREPPGGEEPNREADQSPVVILEKFLTSRATAGREQHLVTSRSSQRQDLEHFVENDSGCQEVKVEENIQDPQCVAFTCQNQQRANVQPQSHRDLRSVLVKEESSTMLNDASSTEESGHIRWNVAQVTSDNAASPLMEISETDRVCGVTPDFNTSQCIFYPVKEEEREVLLGAAETNPGRLSTQASVDVQQTQHHTADTSLPDEERHDEQDYQDTRLPGRGADGFEQVDLSAEADVEWQNAPDLRSFLLQSSDEEDGGSFELSSPQMDAEAAVMACFYEDQTSSSLPPDATQHNLPAPKQPIEFFSQYFGWDTWVEMAQCTNRLSAVSNQVTAKEVAQFVGIHIAMGTLKFPCPGLYWEDLTKVPLIAEAMPRSRFVQLSGMLKLASPAKNPVSCNAGEEGNYTFAQQSGSRQNETSQHTYRCQRNMLNKRNSSERQLDPLWNVQTLLCRFQKACRSLRRVGEYGVDQYPLPLTGKMHNNNLSLCCTTLIGFGGLVSHVDLKLDLSDKEDAVEKMVPKGSMVFLCKQELSTPAMLERLLVAGIHGAGRVGGAKGQIGDEFISSDGKLMLRRSHCGFLLSTAGSGQRNMASLTDNFEKAQRSARLNRDLQKLYSIPLTASAPTCWPQSVLWYLTDLALVNSWLLHRRDHRCAPLTLMAFRLEVAKALILSSGSDTQDSVPPQLSTEMTHAPREAPSPPSLVEESPLPDEATRYDGLGHWPEQLAEGEEGRCRFGDCQRTSRVLCLKCCVFLCISRNHNCFLNFHNQGSSGKR